MGGSDDPSNLVELTVEEHAEAHRKLYEEHGKWQDKVAWLSLSGNISNEEARIMAVKLANTGRTQSEEHIKKRVAARMKTNSKPTLGKSWNRTAESKENISKVMKQKYTDGFNPRTGTTHSAETLSKMSESAKNRPRVPCPECGTLLQKANLSRHIGTKSCTSAQQE